MWPHVGIILGTAPLSNSWIISIIWLYIALNRTPNTGLLLGGVSTQVLFIDLEPQGRVSDHPGHNNKSYGLEVKRGARVLHPPMDACRSCLEVHGA